MNFQDSGRESVPCLTASALRLFGREPRIPFEVRCENHEGDDGKIVFSRPLLRVLPGKRMVGEARWRGQRVLAKLFIAPGARHYERERQGLFWLREAGLPVPALLDAGALDGGGHYLLTEFLEDSQTLDDEAWLAPDKKGAEAETETLSVLRRAFQLFGQLHAAGLIQTDAHLGNFLRYREAIFLIDGDGVARMQGDAAARACNARDNLALLIAQLPPAWESAKPPVREGVQTCLDILLEAYAEQTQVLPAREDLRRSVEQARSRRLQRFLGKTLRDCSQFAVQRTFRRFSSMLRAEQETLIPLMASLDQAIAAGSRFKDGGTCTVARVEVGGRPLLVKRYNIKSLPHGLSRGWRPSRAWHSWLAAHRLIFLGIPTPAPLALIEERFGPWRRRAFLITEFCPGENLLQHLSPEREPATTEAASIDALFEQLFRQRLTHGDMKATNFLWHDGHLVLIDLDTLTPHHNEGNFARSWRRDRARFLRNWPDDSVLYRWLDARLPGK